MNDAEVFRRNVLKEMYVKGLTLKELAYRAGIPYSTMLSYVRSKKTNLPNVITGAKIANALGVSVESLIKLESMHNVRDCEPVIKELSILSSPLKHAIALIIHKLCEKK